MADAAPTPSQTVGPFFSIGMAWLHSPELVVPSHPDAIELSGEVRDGAGDPVPDALIEIFQADPDGRFAPETEAGWSGFGRCVVDGAGCFRFSTVKPGSVAPNEAPHLDVSVFARGLLQRLVTRCYFADEEANATDPLLGSLADPARSTLVAQHVAEGSYRFDITLQGDEETAFFAW